MSTVYDCNNEASRAAGLNAARGALKAGRLVVVPTDTVYGIAADAFDSDAVTALLRAKGRGRDMPVPVLVAPGDHRRSRRLCASRGAGVDPRVLPGGLSLVVHQAPSLAWDLGDTRGTVMLRMPLHPVILELLREVGPLAVSSANVSGRPPATNVTEAREQLGASASVYLDGGPAEHGVASTIVDLTGDRPRILREGAVTAEALAEVLGDDPERLRSGGE